MTEEKPTKAGQIKLGPDYHGKNIQYVSIWNRLTKEFEWSRVL